MKNVTRILPSTPIKLRVVHKRQFIYHIQNSEKKKVKEFERPNFACASLSRFTHFDCLKLVQCLHFKFIIRIKSKVRWKVGAGERR